MYRNQSSDLLWKSMVWFLYDRDLRCESVKTLFTHHTAKVCSYMLHVKLNSLFFLSGFSFQEYSQFIGQQLKGKAIS